MLNGPGFHFQQKHNFIGPRMGPDLVMSGLTHGEINYLMASMEISISNIGIRYQSLLIRKAIVNLVFLNLWGTVGNGRVLLFVHLKGSSLTRPILGIPSDFLMMTTLSSKVDLQPRLHVFCVAHFETGFVRDILTRMLVFVA